MRITSYNYAMTEKNRTLSANRWQPAMEPSDKTQPQDRENQLEDHAALRRTSWPTSHVAFQLRKTLEKVYAASHVALWNSCIPIAQKKSSENPTRCFPFSIGVCQRPECRVPEPWSPSDPSPRIWSLRGTNMGTNSCDMLWFSFDIYWCKINLHHLL